MKDSVDIKRFKLLGVVFMAVFALVGAFSASAFALPELLGQSAGAEYSGKNTAANPTFETTKEEKIVCETAKAEGVQETDTLGTFHIHFEKCKSSGFACNTTGDESGIILALGTFHYVFYKLGSGVELGSAILFLPEEQAIKCTALVTLKIKGKVLCPIPEPLTLSTTHSFTCSESKGVPTNTSWWNDEGVEQHAKAETSKNGGAFIESGESATASITFGTSVAFMNSGGGGGGAEPTTLTTKLSGESKEGEELTVLEGSKVKDKATLSGKNASSATGKVTYKVYSNSGCTTLVTSAGEVTVSGGSVPASSEEELEGGKTYYWQAHYGGDSKNSESTSPCTEVLNVKAKTSLSTKLSGESKEGEELAVLEGSKAKDKATLSGTNSSTAGGKVLYKVYSDKECKTLVTEAGEVTVSAGSVPASSEEELEGGETYYWQATYKGDALHQESTSSCGAEVLNVKAKTNLATKLSGEGKEGIEIEVPEETEVTDKAFPSGTHSSSAGGTVTYKVYSDSACKTLVEEAGEVTVSAGVVPASSAVSLSAPGIYYWQATYSGDSLHQGSASACGTEIEVVAAPITVSTTLSSEGETGESITVPEGSLAADTATLSGPGASMASGVIEYKVYSDNKCEDLVAEAGSSLVVGTAVPQSYEPILPAGTYYWQAVYGGDEVNGSAKSACGSEIETVSPTPLTTSLSGAGKSAEELAVPGGTAVSDSATLHGAGTSTATGTVEYDVYADDECEELVTKAGEVGVSGGSIPSSTAETLAVGTYYWQAKYSGDGTHASATSTCGSEVEVVRAATSIATSLTAAGESGTEIEVPEGTKAHDSVTLSGEKASTATGAVEYDVYSDNECKELVAEAGGVGVSGGAASSSEAVELPAGTYYWRAVYSGDTDNEQASDPCGAEVEVVKAAALTDSLSGGGHSGEEIELTEEASVSDTAALHGVNASTATGTVKYSVYSDETCEHLVAEAGEVSVTAGSIPASSGETLPDGTYYWQAVYSGDESHEAATSVCAKTIERVDEAWIVSVGDSYISGEGGRWAGNTESNSQSDLIDALGDRAYFGEPNGEPGGEAIPFCHRSKSAEIFIGGGVKSKSFACSGARTASFSTGNWWRTGEFKPGLDFASVARGAALPGGGTCWMTGGCEGQALQLEEFATARAARKESIKMVIVSIGGNDFGFGSVIEACFLAFLKRECNKEAAQIARFEPAAVAAREAAIEGGITNVGRAMEKAGYAKNEYTIIVQDYPSPIPENGFEFRYGELERTRAGFPTRLTVGGCPFNNVDAKWANATALKTIDETAKKAAENVNAGGAGLYKVGFMELKGAFNGRRLCEVNLRLVGAGRPAAPPLRWTAPNAVDETEWVNQLRIITARTPFFIAESIHPNFWGQLALRNCARKAYSNGAPKGGTCTIEGPGLTAAAGGALPIRRREPRMELK